jgi:2-oxoglutarate dehydrogenase E1 component
MPVQAQPNIQVAGVPAQPQTTQVSSVTSTTAAVVSPAPVQSQPIVREVAAAPSTPAQADVKPAPTLASPSASTMEPLRGVAGRVVQSMEASLTVPTATSVRAVPAKLMIDNRIVINNHLARGRGGKVSFTHIIAYAQ